jgi:hypothetical protein
MSQETICLLYKHQTGKIFSGEIDVQSLNIMKALNIFARKNTEVLNVEGDGKYCSLCA